MNKKYYKEKSKEDQYIDRYNRDTRIIFLVAFVLLILILGFFEILW